MRSGKATRFSHLPIEILDRVLGSPPLGKEVKLEQSHM